METEKKLFRLINAEREDKIFIDQPRQKETRRIKVLSAAEICIEIGRGKAVAFLVRKTKILRPQERNGRFVFEHCDGGIVVGQNLFGFWLVFVRFDNDDHTGLVVKGDLADNLQELRLPKQFSGCVKTAMSLNNSVKKLTSPKPQLAYV